MGLVTQEQELRELVIKHAAALPKQQRAIADYLLENLRKVPFLSVPELADRIGVSEATIVRFAQRIGFAGFAELKMDLVDILQERLSGDHEEPPLEETGDVLVAVADLEASNIRRTIGAIDRETFTAVADALFSAEHIYVFGRGVSSHMAELAGYTLTQIGLRVVALSTRFSSPLEQLIMVRPEDVLIGLSFPPYSRQTLEMLTGASDRGARTVALCDRVTAPAANIADWVLAVKTDNMMFTNAVAAITVLVNALATEVATRHRTEALEAFSHINKALTESPEIIPPER